MSGITRRQLISSAAALPGFAHAATEAPTAPVVIAKSAAYGPGLVPVMSKMFDRLGGLGRLVKGKTVAIKVNLTGTPSSRGGYNPIELGPWVHYDVIGATIHLMGRAGARRIRLLESPWKSAEPLEEYMLEAGWEPRDFLSAAPRVEFENTNFLGQGKRYSRLWTPKGGHMFKAFDLNHSYEDCDVFVSLAKLKEHSAAGITLSIKNCFGITPCTIYGDGAGVNEPSLIPRGGRGPLHRGQRQPAKPALPENDPTTPRSDGYRLPRIVADLVAARPVHLAIIDGIRTLTGGEGERPTSCFVAPGVIVAGTNCVTTDAVAAAVMGFDPMAERGTPPFERCDNTMRMAEDLGIGTRDLQRIEVIGPSIREIKFDFRACRGSTPCGGPPDRAAQPATYVSNSSTSRPDGDTARSEPKLSRFPGAPPGLSG